MTRYAVALAASLAAMAAWSAFMVGTGKRVEQVRVEKIGKKLDARAKVARKVVEAKSPEAVRDDLRRFCRDCD